MTNALELNHMGLVEMDALEMEQTDGGGLLGFVRDYVIGKVVDVIVDFATAGPARPTSTTVSQCDNV